MAIIPAYAQLHDGTITSTVEVTDSAMVDIDARRVLGIETLDGGDWRNALAALAMTGRLAILPAG